MSETPIENNPSFFFTENLGHVIDYSCDFSDGEKLTAIGIDDKKQIAAVGSDIDDVIISQVDKNGIVIVPRWDSVSLNDITSDKRVLQQDWCKLFIQALGRTCLEWKGHYSISRLVDGVSDLLAVPIPDTKNPSWTVQKDQDWINELIDAGRWDDEPSEEECVHHKQRGKIILKEWKRSGY